MLISKYAPLTSTPKLKKYYQGSDPKEPEESIIKESIKEGVAALNKTDDSGVQLF